MPHEDAATMRENGFPKLVDHKFHLRRAVGAEVSAVVELSGGGGGRLRELGEEAVHGCGVGVEGELEDLAWGEKRVWGVVGRVDGEEELVVDGGAVGVVVIAGDGGCGDVRDEVGEVLRNVRVDGEVGGLGCGVLVGLRR